MKTLKIIFIIFSYLSSLFYLTDLKNLLYSLRYNPPLTSVLWMAFPITLINTIILFFKGPYDFQWNIKLINILNQWSKNITRNLLFFHFIFELIIFIFFCYLSPLASFFIMLCLHFISLNNFIGLLFLPVGLFFAIISNTYFKIKKSITNEKQ